jgi:hypothetical protein
MVNFSVTPADAVGLTHGAKISFELDGKSYPVSLVGVPSAPINGLVPLQAMLPGNFPGGFGTVGSVSYAMTLAQGTLVPLPAIQSLENSTYVYRVGKDSKTTQAKIVILADSGVFAAVTGINDGDLVVLNPPPGLLPGATVKAVQVAADGQTPSPAPGQAQGSQAQGQDGQKQWQGQRKDQNAAAQGGGTR